jgi:choline-glycine betaine transporter
MFWPPVGLFAVLVFISLIRPTEFLNVASRINAFILDQFSHAFAYAGFAFVLICIWALLSPLGRVRIGGADAKPMLSRLNWMAITLTTTIAIGILFWATAEPIYHLFEPGRGDIAPESNPAARSAMTTLYMHWAITPYAIYTVPGLAFALAYYNLKKPFSLASPLSVLVQRDIPSPVASGLDSVALISLLLGLSASLGAGILSIAGGLEQMGIASMSTPLLMGIALTVVAAFFISSATGLQRGIRVLSDINTKIFVALLIFILIAGPTLFMVKLSAEATLGYIREFIPRSLLLSPHNDEAWTQAWTVFYFANWMAWAPLSAMFLARISRGYTVREYIVVNLILPAFFSMLWMSLFGGLALHTELDGGGGLQALLETLGPESVLYGALEALPFTPLLVALVVLLTFLSYVTAADSNMDVVASLSAKPVGRQAVMIKGLTALCVGVAAGSMVALSGIDGVRMLSNLGGLPALFILIAFGASLIIMGTVKLKTLQSV